MYELIVKSRFSAAHRIEDSDGLCENLHGHNYYVDVLLKAEKLNNADMVEDFHIVKKKLKEVLSVLDHKNLNELDFFRDRSPTTETIAELLFEMLKKKIRSLKKVTVWEDIDTGCSFYDKSSGLRN